MPSDASQSDRGMRIFSVSSGIISLASFSFRLSLDERFHKMPTRIQIRGSLVKVLNVP